MGGPDHFSIITSRGNEIKFEKARGIGLAKKIDQVTLSSYSYKVIILISKKLDCLKKAECEIHIFYGNVK